MKPGVIPLRLLAAFVLALSVSACAIKSYRIDTSPQSAIEQRAVVQEQGAFRISASVPSSEEAQTLFGLPLHDSGIQAVWLEIVNHSAHRARFAPYSVDPDYFPPYEVAYMHRKSFRKDALPTMESYLKSQSIVRQIPPGATVSGYLFTNADPGTKSFNVDIHYTGGEARNEHFTFFVDVPGFVPDHAEVDFASLYRADAIRNLSSDEFRAFLAIDWPCCTSNHDGSLDGRPINAIFISLGDDLLQALLRAKWSENSREKDSNYLLNIDYYFNRPPDAIFRKKREYGTDRDEMSLWLAPMRVDGKPVWVAQVKHAIGRMFNIGEYFFGVHQDPDADEGRNFILQDLWYSQSLEAFAWSENGRSVPQEDPRIDFNGNPWYSDGFISVQWISGEPVSLKDTELLIWDRLIRTPGETE